MLPEITSLADPIINSFLKELENKRAKEVNKDILIDQGLI